MTGYTKTIVGPASSNAMYGHPRNIPNVFTRYQLIRVTEEEWKKQLDYYFPTDERDWNSSQKSCWLHLRYRNEWFQQIQLIPEQKRAAIRKVLYQMANKNFAWLPMNAKSRLWHNIEDKKAFLRYPAQKGGQRNNFTHGQIRRGEEPVNWQKIALRPGTRLSGQVESRLREGVEVSGTQLWYESDDADGIDEMETDD